MSTPVNAATVAAEFGVTATTVLNWARTGQIPSVVSVGKTYRFDLEQVRAAVAKPATKPLDLRPAKD